jgi:predicted kinase
MSTILDDEEIVNEYNLSDFQIFVDNFKATNIWKNMQATVENSPWHREDNVALHTEMAIGEAVKILDVEYPAGSIQNDRMRILVTLALLFHDTGKPEAETEKESEERGVYRSYAGHEQMSARVFESYAIDNWAELSHIITPWDVFTVTWMIEHHLPYSLKQPQKVKALASGLKTLFKDGAIDTFYIMLRGDTSGRISDNWDTNYQNMMAWIDDMKQQVASLSEYEEGTFDTMSQHKRLIVLIGAPGSGKSTIRNIMSEDMVVFSLDDLRVEYLKSHPTFDQSQQQTPDDIYRQAFALSCTDSGFAKFSNDRLNTLFKFHDSVIVDNTNTSIKTRKQYLELAHKHKFTTMAYYVPASLNLLINRNNTRTDKTLSVDAIVRLYNSIALPSQGEFAEFDAVYVMTHNFWAIE